MNFALTAGFLPLEGDRHSDVELFSIVDFGLKHFFLMFFQESDVFLVNFDGPSFVCIALFRHKLLIGFFPQLLLDKGHMLDGVGHISI